MGGRRTAKDELLQLEALTKEGLTARDIAQKLGRSQAAIRNLRYKKHLITRAEDETRILWFSPFQIHVWFFEQQPRLCCGSIAVEKLRLEGELKRRD